MNLKIFAVRDSKSGVYLTPFYARSVVDCKRMVSSSLDDPGILKTPLGSHPEDFELFELGSFDDEIGNIHGLSSPLFICQIAVLLPKPVISTVPS